MCGIVGIIGSNDASTEAFLALTTLQHRGQDAAGILTHDESGFHMVKNRGLVESIFTRDNMTHLTGNMAIAHNRYSTAGHGAIDEVQPFLINYPFGIGIVHNGNVVNCDELALGLKKQKRHLLTHSDTEILLNLLAAEIASEQTHENDALNFDQLSNAVLKILESVNGSFSVVSMIADQGLLAFRDPNGIRPLVWGKKKNSSQQDPSELAEAHMVASESVALDFCGYEKVRNLAPGELLFIDKTGKVHAKVLKGQQKKHCMFEWIYFASPESVIDGVPVYGARIQLGKNLAKHVKTELAKKGLHADLVVPVPETARIAAIALSEELEVPYREVLIKNRYIKRTFILETQDKRQKAVNLKLSPVKSEIVGKNVLLVDDSIVRGTTSKKIIELVRKAGAAKVFFVSTCPPIRKPCFYGIDFPSEQELIASNKENLEIEKELRADAVIYQDQEGLSRSIIDAQSICSNSQLDKTARESDVKAFTPCMACLDGKYPTDVSQTGIKFAASRAKQKEHISKGESAKTRMMHDVIPN